MNKSKLLIVNNYYHVKKEIDKVTAPLQLKDMNYSKISEKIDIKDLLTNISTLPFIDQYRVIQLNVSLFTKAELKKITDAIKNQKNTILICVYYCKDKLDKGDKGTVDLFSKQGIEVIKSITINLQEVQFLLKEKGLAHVDANIFMDADNMDVVVNDIEKLRMLDRNINLQDYISKSFMNNVFDLIRAISQRDLTLTLDILKQLLEKENKVTINIILLKHFNSLRQIKELTNNSCDLREELYRREKLATGKGSYIHPYRLKILTSEAIKSKIDLEYATEVLLKNELDKNFDLEIGITKIIGRMEN
ncbi:MAG: hypothetical protein RR620_08555 [Clostridium sp.]